ncbi:unnamed protein product [Linum trigynum]|uniref:Uncharacterized protein n=1 Tax=Linum trigynum TaxID=586398 RepID=A0AAV2EXQ1_9ROSI
MVTGDGALHTVTAFAYENRGGGVGDGLHYLFVDLGSISISDVVVSAACPIGASITIKEVSGCRSEGSRFASKQGCHQS